MTETIGWIALLGLGIGAAWIYMFSTKLEQNMRDTIAFLIRSNEQIMAQLERITGKRVEQPEVTFGVVLERRCAQRRDSRFQAQQRADKIEHRRSCGRRSDDLYPA